MYVRNCVRTGLFPSLPPHTQIYALGCTLPPSIDAYVIKVWPHTPFSNVAKLHHAILSFMTYWFNILCSLLSGRFTRLDSIEYQKKLNLRVIVCSNSYCSAQNLTPMCNLLMKVSVESVLILQYHSRQLALLHNYNS